MSLHCSVVCFRGSHLSKIAGLLADLDYRHVGPPASCSTAAEAGALLNQPTGNINVVRKAAYPLDGWTCLFDAEMVVMLEDDALSAFARDHSSEIFVWICEGISGTYGFRMFAPELRRDILAVAGSVVTEVGVPLAEEQGIQWASAREADVLAIAQRLGVPYDYLSGDREYLIYTLDQSHFPTPDLSNVKLPDLPFPAGDIVARVVGRVPTTKKPWWKLW